MDDNFVDDFIFRDFHDFSEKIARDVALMPHLNAGVFALEFDAPLGASRWEGEVICLRLVPYSALLVAVDHARRRRLVARAVSYTHLTLPTKA